MVKHLFVTDNKSFLYCHEAWPCDVCQKESLQGLYYYEAYSSVLPAMQRALCGECNADMRNRPVGYDVCNRMILVTGYVPLGARLWVSQPPRLVAVRDVDSFSAAYRVDGAVVDDQTVYADRPAGLIGAPDTVLIGVRPEALRNPDADPEPLLSLSAKPLDDDMRLLE